MRASPWAVARPGCFLPAIKQLADLKRSVHSFEAATVFVDIAGFTALSEGLAAMGQDGAERLEECIADYFDGLLDEIKGLGGRPIKIAGDSLSLLFEPEEGQGLKTAVMRALVCAGRFQASSRALRDVSLGEGRTFRMAHKVGVGAGTVIMGVLGDAEVGQEVVFCGEAIDRAAFAEHRAAPGEAWVSPEVLHILDLRDAYEHARPVKLRKAWLAHYEKEAQACDIPAFEWSHPLPSHIDRLIPLWLRARIRDGAFRFISRHQTLSIMFVRFHGLNPRQSDDFKALNDYYTAIMRICLECGGHLAEFEAGDKGTKVIIFFGAPKVTERPALGAVRCARAIQRLGCGHQRIQNQQIGITTSRVYVGFIGCKALLKYSAMGDGVNVSARLMGIAPDWGILADEETQLMTREDVDWGPLTSIRLKGRVEKVSVALLNDGGGSSSRLDRRGVGLFGREREVERFGVFVELARKGCGTFMLMEGGPGVGKTRLLDAFGGAARRSGVYLRTGVELFEESRVPFSGLVGLIERAIGLESSERNRRDAFVRWVAGVPSHRRREARRVAPILDLHEEDDPELASMNEVSVRAMRRHAVVDCIRGAFSERPALITIDNAHFLDSASIQVLVELAALLPELPLVIILAYRSGLGDERLGPIRALKNALSLPLSELDPSSARLLAMERIGARFIDSELERFLQRHTGGNPLKLEAWIDTLIHRGIIRVHLDVAYLSRETEIGALPSRLEGLALARLECLSASVVQVLKVASVIGRQFDVRFLAAVHPERLPIESIRGELNRACKAGLLRHTRDQGDRYHFSQPELREALYDGLAYRLRREIHQACIRYIEGHGDITDSRRTLSLACHAEYHPDPSRQFELFRSAREIAEADNDRAAIILWARKELKTQVCREEYTKCHEAYRALQGALTHAGRLESALDLTRAWRKEAETRGTEQHAIAARCAEATILNYLSRSDEAMALLSESIVKARHLRNKECLVHTLCMAVNVLGGLGRFNEALAMADEALGIAESGGSGQLLSVLIQRAYCLTELGRAEEALNVYREALENRVTSNSIEKALVLGNLGIQLWTLGQGEEAHFMLLESLKLRRRIGDRLNEAAALTNVGYSLYRLGDVHASRAYLEESHRLFSRLSIVVGQVVSQTNLGTLCRIQGDYQEAKAFFDRAEVSLGLHPHAQQFVELRLEQGELALSMEHCDQALSYFSQAIDLARGLNDRTSLAVGLEGFSAALLALGRIEEAAMAVQSALGELRLGVRVDFPLRIWKRAFDVEEAQSIPLDESRVAREAFQALRTEMDNIRSVKVRERILSIFSWKRHVLSLALQQGFSHAQSPRIFSSGARREGGAGTHHGHLLEETDR